MKRSKGGVAWNVDSPFACTPPGTPPPPYHGTPQQHKENSVPSPPVPPPPDEIDESNKDGVSVDINGKFVYLKNQIFQFDGNLNDNVIFLRFIFSVSS